jgi:hypothetical protein
MDSKPSVVLPPGTVDLASEVVPAVRALLRRGLPDDFVRACVRVGAFEAFGGGYKSELVGGLRIDVNAAMKLGGEELDRHVLLMERVNKTRPRTFPSVQAVVPLDRGRRLLFMEQLMSHTTLLDLVYRRRTAVSDLDRILDNAFVGVRAVRRTTREQAPALRKIPRTSDPYGKRLRTKLETITTIDPELAPLWERAGSVLGEKVPPLTPLLACLDAWLGSALPAAPKMLCHGDLHLGNVMARRRGRGFSVRMIDPNPEIGITDPLYDAGKLLHFAEPVGWAAIDPAHCRATLRLRAKSYSLTPRLSPSSASAERRRASFEALLRERLMSVRRKDETRAPRLEVATAAAHVGLAALLSEKRDESARRFVLAHALRALGAWHRMVMTEAAAPSRGSDA